MDLDQLKDNWQRFGLEDPLWAIATDPSTKGNRWDIERFYDSGRRTVAQAMNLVLELRPDLRRGCALDFGCGVGRLTRGIEQFFERVVGVDIAASMIEKARALSPPDSRCSYVLNENPDLRLFEDASFDFVLTFIVLQHMRQEYSSKYLAEFIRILRPGGLCLFQLPDFLMNVAPPAADGGPVMEMYGMSPATVAELIARQGATVLSVEENEWAGPEVRSFTYLVEKKTAEQLETTGSAGPAADSAPWALVDDLGSRLQSAREQEQGVRLETRRLARELDLTRRLLAVSLAGAPARRPAQPIPNESGEPARAVAVSEARLGLDLCEDRGSSTVLRGWAFLPSPGWNCRQARITVLFRDGVRTFAVPATPGLRPDVAAHFAARPAEDSGGAAGLDAAGFACEVANDSLPMGKQLEILLRLESSDVTCEQPTGRHLRLKGPKRTARFASPWRSDR